jgi:hypothetical protein
MSAPRHIDNHDYLAAQIDCLRALITCIANQTLRREEFREGGLASLERLRVATLNLPTSDARLTAIEHEEAWLKRLTE